MKLIRLLSLAALSFLSVFRPEREEHHNSAAPSPHPEGIVGRKAEAAFSVRYLLAKKGSATGSIDICGATDEPFGVCLDTPGIGDRAAVRASGVGAGTQTMIASKALADGVRVYTTAGGKITDTAVNNCRLVGKTHGTAAADGDPVEVIPCFPVLTTV